MSITAAQSNCTLKPDLILLTCLLADLGRTPADILRRMWPAAKTFAVVCNAAGKHQPKMPAALYHIDDFLFCPFAATEFLVRMKRLIQEDSTCISAPSKGLEVLIGRSETFLDAVRKLKLLAQSKAPVLISGETGSGKELFARGIHYQSSRNAGAFIPVNCGALPDELFENELFGHVKGAYTNAVSAEKGLVAEADGGTLFLDEVDALSPAAQIKLLRFVQSGEYRPLGASSATVAETRIIAATNADLTRCVEQKLFREDLHYRLNVLSVAIPPLRDRANDVLDLAAHFVSLYASEHGRPAPRLAEDAIMALLNYSWPGNVRELQGVLQRAIVLRPSLLITAADLDLPVSGEDYINQADPFRFGKLKAIVQFERTFIAKLLAAHGGNISRAAKAAGKDRRSFQRLVNKYALDRKSFEHHSH